MGPTKNEHDCQRDIHRVAKIFRDGGYSYDQSKHLFDEARRQADPTLPRRKRGSGDRLAREELDALLHTAYEQSFSTFYMILFGTLSRPPGAG